MSPVKRAAEALSSSTPITTALAIALCSGAFWTGGLATRLSSVEEDRAELLQISSELKEISRDNQRRIEWLERNQIE